jgi:putative endonuclease
VPFVYLLRCRDGTLYAGAAMNLTRRLVEHGAGRASRYTRGRLPVALAWSRQVESWSAALRLEVRLKRLERAAKEALVSGGADLPEGDSPSLGGAAGGARKGVSSRAASRGGASGGSPSGGGATEGAPHGGGQARGSAAAAEGGVAKVSARRSGRARSAKR